MIKLLNNQTEKNDKIIKDDINATKKYIHKKINENNNKLYFANIIKV